MRVPEPMVTVTEAASTLPVSPVMENPAAFSAMFTTSSPAIASRLSDRVGVGIGVAVADVVAPSPTALTALTSNVCSTPLSRPVTVYDLSSLRSVPESEPSGTLVQSGLQVAPPSSLTRYWYPVTAEPPSKAGGVHLSVTCVSPAVAFRLAGAPGTVTGVDVAVTSAPPPTVFTALTSKVCRTPLSRPVTVKEVSSLRSVPVSEPSGTPVHSSGNSPLVL